MQSGFKSQIDIHPMTTFADYKIQIAEGTPGPEVATTCPQCSDQRKKKNAKCLSVNVEKRVWHCSHCGWAGGLGNGDFSVPNPYSAPKYRKPKPRQQRSLSNRTLEWFRARCINEQVLKRNGVYSDIAYMPQIEDSEETIVFPYRRGGELINRKYRALAEKRFRLESGCELILFGLDDIDPEKPLIWCEGEGDKLACEVAGYRNVVSVPNGAPQPNAKHLETRFNFLDADREKIDSVTEHILAVDSDETGAKLEHELACRLGIGKCKRVRWPEGRKDANDVLVSDGADGLRWFIENAEPYPELNIERDEQTSEQQSATDEAEVEGTLRPLTSEGERIMVCIGCAIRQTRFGKKDYLRWRETKDGPVLEQFFPHYDKYPFNSKAVENFIVAMGKRPKRLDRLSLRALVGLKAVVYVETVKPTYGSGSLKGRPKPEATHYSKVSEILRPLGYVDAQVLDELRKEISNQ